MNSEILHNEVNSKLENKEVYSEYGEYLELETVRQTENEFIRITEDENYRIV